MIEDSIYNDLYEYCQSYRELKELLERLLERANQDYEEVQAIIDEDIKTSLEEE